jgi:hypothetical protein
LGIAALFSFAGAVPDEIYRQGDAKRGTNIPLVHGGGEISMIEWREEEKDKERPVT